MLDEYSSLKSSLSFLILSKCLPPVISFKLLLRATAATTTSAAGKGLPIFQKLWGYFQSKIVVVFGWIKYIKA